MKNNYYALSKYIIQIREFDYIFVTKLYFIFLCYYDSTKIFRRDIINYLFPYLIYDELQGEEFEIFLVYLRTLIEVKVGVLICDLEKLRRLINKAKDNKEIKGGHRKALLSILESDVSTCTCSVISGSTGYI